MYLVEPCTFVMYEHEFVCILVYNWSKERDLRSTPSSVEATRSLLTVCEVPMSVSLCSH